MLHGSPRVLPPLLAMALVAPITGCHDDTPTRPVSVIVTTPAPVHGVIAHTSFSGFGTDVWMSIPLQLPQKGVLDITVNWTTPSTWLYVDFGDKNCLYDELAKKTCPFLIRSETKDPKPRVLYTDVLEPATYYIFLYNVPYNVHTGIGSNNTEAVSVTIGLTVGGSAQRVEVPVRLSQPVMVTPPRT
jgi:hypothetical protein